MEITLKYTDCEWIDTTCRHIFSGVRVDCVDRVDGLQKIARTPEFSKWYCSQVLRSKVLTAIDLVALQRRRLINESTKRSSEI